MSLFKINQCRKSRVWNTIVITKLIWVDCTNFELGKVEPTEFFTGRFRIDKRTVIITIQCVFIHVRCDIVIVLIRYCGCCCGLWMRIMRWSGLMNGVQVRVCYRWRCQLRLNWIWLMNKCIDRWTVVIWNSISFKIKLTCYQQWLQDICVPIYYKIRNKRIKMINDLSAKKKKY